MKRKNIISMICAVFVFLFLYTAISKLIEFRSFSVVLKQLPLIAQHALLVAWLLPVTEIFVAILLFFPGTQHPGLYATSFLMLVFTGYIIYMLMYSPHIPCSCGGVIRQMTWGQHLGFNVILLFLSITAVYFKGREVSRKPLTE